jgi:hypothetical protein
MHEHWQSQAEEGRETSLDVAVRHERVRGESAVKGKGKRKEEAGTKDAPKRRRRTLALCGDDPSRYRKNAAPASCGPPE